jgi:glycogen synthase kinase 3 beta
MEFCEFSLEQKLREACDTKSSVPMAHVKHYSRELFAGLSQMHSHGISHRDLKPENILLKQKLGSKDPMHSVLKIADLGAAKVLDTSDRHMNTPYVVSRYYRAPELILGSNLYDCSIDVWAAGCILFELLTKTPLFPGDSEGLQLLEQA